MENLKEIIKEANSELLAELRKQGFMKDTRFSAYQKTEQLLYNYNNFKDVIVEKENHIKFIGESGIQKKSKSITSFAGEGSQFNTSTDADKAEELIESLLKSIFMTKRYIKIIDDALQKISSDAYYDIISLRYFEGKTREYIAEYFDVDVATISRNKNRLINNLKIHLFSDDVIIELFR